MAGDWIVWTKGLARKREVGRIVKATGMSRYEVAVKLMEFWEWVDSETADGLLPGLDVRSLSALHADICPQFFRALSDVGWLEERTEGVLIPKFDRWMGRSAKRRLTDALRKREGRGRSEGEGGEGDAPENGHAGGQVAPAGVRETSAPHADVSRTFCGTTEQNRTEKRKNPPTPLTGGKAGVLPEPIDTPEVREWWDRWVTHRSEIRHALKPTTAQAQLRKLASMGAGRALAALRFSIEQGYQGLFEPQGGGAVRPSKPTRAEIIERFKNDPALSGTGGPK